MRHDSSEPGFTSCQARVDEGTLEDVGEVDTCVYNNYHINLLSSFLVRDMNFLYFQACNVELSHGIVAQDLDAFPLSASFQNIIFLDSLRVHFRTLVQMMSVQLLQKCWFSPKSSRKGEKTEMGRTNTASEDARLCRWNESLPLQKPSRTF